MAKKKELISFRPNDMKTAIIWPALTGLATVELFLRAGVTSRFITLAGIGVRAAKVLRRRASDHWKERAISRLWVNMMQSTALLTATILLVLLPLLVLYVTSNMFGLELFAAMDFGLSHLALIAVLIAYAAMRRRQMRGL